MNTIDDEMCCGYTNTSGKNKGKLSRQNRVAQESCTKAHGPKPFPEAVCRHLCKNDSNVKPRGEDSFICINPAHIEWNTYSQNTLDSYAERPGANKGKTFSPEVRAKMSAAHKGPRGPYGPRKTKTTSTTTI